MKLKLLFFTMAMFVVGMICAVPADAALRGLWEFEDGDNLEVATIGTDLILVGFDAAVAGSGGPDTGASALDDYSAGGGYYVVTNPIGANGSGTRTNAFTLLMDIKMPGGVTSYNALAEFDRDLDTGSDSDYFLDWDDDTNDRIGVANQGYVITNGFLGSDWHRIVLSVENSVKRTTYIDGVDLGDHNLGDIDGRWSLDDKFYVFFDGDLGEELLTHVSNLALYDTALNASQVAALGLVGQPLIPVIPGDANTDTMVDVSDLGILATNYGTMSGMEWADADFTGDGAVDVSDLGILATNYGFGTAAAAAVPEPSMLMLLVVGGLTLIIRRRR